MSEAAEAKKKSPVSLKFAVFAALVIAGIFFPTTVLLCGCMLPTFVAALVDNNLHKTAGMTVGAMNLAGSVPAWLHLWRSGHNLENALSLLMDPETLLVAYGAAAAGWIVYIYIPPVVAAFLVRKYEKRLKDIEKRQKELVRKWGAEVSP